MAAADVIGMGLSLRPHSLFFKAHGILVQPACVPPVEECWQRLFKQQALPRLVLKSTWLNGAVGVRISPRAAASWTNDKLRELDCTRDHPSKLALQRARAGTDWHLTSLQRCQDGLFMAQQCRKQHAASVLALLPAGDARAFYRKISACPSQRSVLPDALHQRVMSRVSHVLPTTDAAQIR